MIPLFKKKEKNLSSYCSECALQGEAIAKDQKIAELNMLLDATSASLDEANKEIQYLNSCLKKKESIIEEHKQIMKEQREELNKYRTYKNITGSLVFKNLRMIDFRQFYDCEWSFEVSENEGAFEKITLVFSDSYINEIERVLEVLALCETIEDVKESDQRKNIYYD